jgi:hypothetical protein
LTQDQIADLDHLVTDTSLGRGVVVFKVWSPDGRILYSLDRSLIGRQFSISDEFHTALQGQVTADVSDLNEPENERERSIWSRLIEVYAPVLRDGDGELIAVNEFYLSPDVLEAEMTSARLRAWVIVGALGAVLYLLTAGIVERGSGTIERQRARLEERVVELGALHGRVLQAAKRTTALNEQMWCRTPSTTRCGRSARFPAGSAFPGWKAYPCQMCWSVWSPTMSGAAVHQLCVFSRDCRRALRSR